MASNQAIKYAPQCGDLAVESLVFQTNNVVGNFNYPPTVPAYKTICKFLMNFPLKTAFTKCPSVLYQNFLREFWCTIIAYDPNLSTDEKKPRLLKEFLIKFTVMNGKKPLTLNFNTFTTSTSLDYNNGAYVAYPSLEVVKAKLQLITYSLIIGTKVDIGDIIYSDLVTKLLNKSRLRYVSYLRFISCVLEALLGLKSTQDENFWYLPGILSNSNFSKDPSKVTEIKLTVHMIAVNNQKDSVSPPPLTAKKMKWKSQTVTPTLPKSQPMEGSEQSHSDSSSTVPDPQDLERNIQLASTGLPSTLDEGTYKSQPLPKGTDAKYQANQTQSARLRYQSLTKNKGKTSSEVEPNIEALQLKIFADVQALLLSDDEMVQESEKEKVFVAGEDMDADTQMDIEVQSPLPNTDKLEYSPVQDTDESTSDLIPDLKKFDNILPLIERQLVKYLRKAAIEGYYEENINHREQTDKVIDVAMNSLDKNNIARGDLLNALNRVTKALKAI
ncbi:hypothetical protein Tco_1502676 [Tanacetum coccineum]